MDSDQDVRVLFLSLEYAEPYLFSGNGVYSRSFVHNLTRTEKTRVMVICGRPAGQQQVRIRPPTSTSSSYQTPNGNKTSGTSNGHSTSARIQFTATDFTREGSKIEVYTVSLPVWFKLDRHSSWREFGEGVSRYAPKVAQFRPHIVLGVDWTSRNAWESLRRNPETKLSNVPLIYLCFRVFSATPGLSQEERTFYAQREAEIIQSAVRTVALSRCDALALDNLRTMTLPRGAEVVKGASALIQVITPPLRDDVRNASLKLSRTPLAVQPQKKKWTSWSHSQMSAVPPIGLAAAAAPVDQPSFASRCFITCCARISPEKEVMKFVEIVESIQSYLKENELVPYLVGPVADEDYARKVYQRLKRAFPGDTSIVVSDFIPADKLQSIFSRTVINVHPARMEPFGMSITEAAAFGVPTLLDANGQVGATDVLPFSENKSIACNMRVVRHASATLKTILRKEGRAILEVIGKRAQDAVLRWGSAEWASHVRKELLEDILQLHKGSVIAFPGSTVSNLGLGIGQNGRHAHDVPITVEEEGLWLELTEWAAEQLMLNPAFSASVEDKVLAIDVDGVRLVVEQLIKLSAYSLASFLLSSKNSKQITPVEMTEDLYRWARMLLSSYSSCLGPARFRLVPSRMSEDTFWGLFFALIRDGVQRLVANSQNMTADSTSPSVAQTDTMTNPSDGSLADQHSGDDDNNSLKRESSTSAGSRLDNSAIAIERLVQRDECGRGIAPIVEFVGKGVLADSARSIFQAKRVLILTGFPCLLNGPSPQETDGPPGAVAIARACVALNKRVTFVIEEPIASVLRAAIAQVFPKTKTMLLRSHGLTQIESFAKGQVTLEIFPALSDFKPDHYKRLDEILSEFAAEASHMIAIERAGPAHDGKCRTMRARVMSDSLLAPLHILFERAKQWNIETTGIGDGGNEVGMGKAYDVVKAKMGESIACTTKCDYLIPCSVSNWGGHALTAGLALVALERHAIPTSESVAELCVGSDKLHSEIVNACIQAGAADGITSKRDVPSVDGLPFSKTLEVIRGLRKIVGEFEPDRLS